MRRQVGDERRVVLFDDPVEQCLLGPVALVGVGAPFPFGTPCDMLTELTRRLLVPAGDAQRRAHAGGKRVKTGSGCRTMSFSPPIIRQ